MDRIERDYECCFCENGCKCDKDSKLHNIDIKKQLIQVVCLLEMLFVSLSRIVVIKMFLRWFFANEKFIITSTALKLCDVMDDVMT